MPTVRRRFTGIGSSTEWTNPSNAADEGIVAYAEKTTTEHSILSVLPLNVIRFTGFTDANQTITDVKVRFYVANSNTEADSLKVNLYDSSSGDLVYESVVNQPTPDWTGVYTPTTPSGGWTWADINGGRYTCRFYDRSATGWTGQRVYTAELIVTYTGLSPGTINNFWGAETGGLEELQSSSSGAASTTQKHSGGYSYQLTNTASIGLNPFDSVADVGAGRIFGCWCYKDTGATLSISFADSVGTICVATFTSGEGLDVYDANDATNYTVPSACPTLTWFLVEIYIYPDASGTIIVFVDGVQKYIRTGADLTDGGTLSTITISSSSLGTNYVDDIYFMSGCLDITNRLGGCEVYSYRSNLNSATPDVGSALTTGTWLAVQTVPFSGTVGATYDGGPIAGAIYTNDVGGSAGTGGPNTDANITGDIKAIKGIWTMERGNGGGTDHFGLLGNSVDGTTRSADFDPATTPATYTMVSSSASVVPTASEYCAIGFEMSNAQDFELYDMLATVLHVPVGTRAIPPFNPARLFAPLLVR